MRLDFGIEVWKRLEVAIIKKKSRDFKLVKGDIFIIFFTHK